MHGKTILSTDRLVLREFNTSDAPFVMDLVNTPDYIKYIVDRNVRSVDDAVNFIEKDFLHSYVLYGFGSFHVSLKEKGTSIGSCGLKKRDYLDYPDIGYALLPEYYGSGYAYEISQAVLKYGIDQLGFSKIHAMILAENEKSINLISKLGFQYDRDLILPVTSERVLLYTYTSNK